MKKKSHPKILLDAIKQVHNKRAKIVLDHIVKYGFITTEDLKNTYGYDHPPRAVKDAKDLGFPIERYSVHSKEGRSIAAYRFGDLSQFDGSVSIARRILPKRFKDELLILQESKCNTCSARFEGRYLQVDHRVPYGIGGEVQGDLHIAEFQLLCGSCNRAKSWSCENCPNWSGTHDAGLCQTCYWGSPECYTHVACSDIRRLDLVWQRSEVASYDRLSKGASKAGEDLPSFVKKALARILPK